MNRLLYTLLLVCPGIGWANTCLELKGGTETFEHHCQLALLANADQGRDRAELLLHLVTQYTHTGAYQKAQRYLDKLKTMGESGIGLAFLMYRRAGILAYRKGKYQRALAEFEQGLVAAKGNAQKARAQADLATTYLAMDDYPQALHFFTLSLALKHELGDTKAIAVTYNNLGSTFKGLSEPLQAYGYYLKASHLFTELGLLGRAAHTEENLALLAIEQKKWQQAQTHIDASLNYFLGEQNTPGMLRGYLLQARLYLSLAQYHKVRQALDSARPLLEKLGESQWQGQYQVLMGKLNLALGHYHKSEKTLQYAQQQAIKSQDLSLAKDSLKTLQQVLLAQGKMFEAVKASEQLLGLIESWQKMNTAGELARAQARLTVSEQAHQLLSLQHKDQAKTLAIAEQRIRINQLVMLFLASVLACGIGAWCWRSRYIRKATAQEMAIKRHKQALALANESNLYLERLLEQVEQAVLVLNNQGTLIYANPKGEALLGTADYASLALCQWLPKSRNAFWTLWQHQEGITHHSLEQVKLRSVNGEEKLVGMQLTALQLQHSVYLICIDHTLPVETEHKLFALQCQPLLYQISQLKPGIKHHDNHDMSKLMLAIDQLESRLEQLAPDAQEQLQLNFRQQLVVMMTTCVDVWQQATRTNKLTLAEQSGLWRITVDDSRLRTRSLDRYLSLKRLPQRPRWKEVMQTSHYILAHCSLTQAQRQLLEQKRQRLNELVEALGLA